MRVRIHGYRQNSGYNESVDGNEGTQLVISNYSNSITLRTMQDGKHIMYTVKDTSLLLKRAISPRELGQVVFSTVKRELDQVAFSTVKRELDQV